MFTRAHHLPLSWTRWPIHALLSYFFMIIPTLPSSSTWSVLQFSPSKPHMHFSSPASMSCTHLSHPPWQQGKTIKLQLHYLHYDYTCIVGAQNINNSYKKLVITQSKKSILSLKFWLLQFFCKGVNNFNTFSTHIRVLLSSTFTDLENMSNQTSKYPTYSGAPIQITR